MPVEYVGTTVHVQESSRHYEIFHGGICIARHAKSTRHAVVVDRAHYRGLLRAGGPAATPRPPQWDPGFGDLGEVMVRDLALYAAVAEPGGAS